MRFGVCCRIPLVSFFHLIGVAFRPSFPQIFPIFASIAGLVQHKSDEKSNPSEFSRKLSSRDQKQYYVYSV